MNDRTALAGVCLLLVLLLVAVGCAPRRGPTLLLGNPDVEASAMTLSLLHTEGRLIKNALGQLVELRGAAVAEMSWQSTADLMPSRIEMLAALTNGNATVVRVCLSSPDGEGKLTNPGSLASEMDKIRDACVANNLYFFCNWHGGASAAQIAAIVADDTAFLAWHTYWGNRYGNPASPKYCTNYLGQESWNEPDKWAGATQAVLRTLQTDLRTELLAINSHLFVFAVSDDYTKVNTDFSATPIADSHVIYVFDDYFYHGVTSPPYTHTVFDTIRGYYAASNNTAAYALMQSVLLDPPSAFNEWSGKNAGASNIPTLWVEGGFGLTEPAQAVDDWHHILADAGVGFTDYMWWDSGTNFGLYSGSVLDRNGLLWAQYLAGIPSVGPPPDRTLDLLIAKRYTYLVARLTSFPVKRYGG